MKPYLFLIAILLTISIISCKIQPETPAASSKSTKLIVSLKKSGCSGECPAFMFELFGDKTVKYNGVRYVARIGEFTGEIDSEMYNRIIDILNTNNLQEYEEVYKRKNVLDLSTTTLIYENKKIVYEFSQAPESLRQVTDQLVNMIDQIKLKSISDH